jgi:farnesyl-diphosphate farnesyltransferase
MDRFVAEHLRGVSRTYAILIPMLPRGLAEPVGLAYLLMRVVDTLEDAPELSANERRARIDAVTPVLERLKSEAAPLSWALPPELTAPIGDLAAERALMLDFGALLHRIGELPLPQRRAMAECALKMCGGVRELLLRSAARGLAYPAIRDARELREYCYYVAGVVGEMLCDMMADYLKQPAVLHLRPLAVELGIGLQLVNILKDALKDSQQGRRYLPLVEGGDVARSEIYRAVLNEARASLQRGTEFVLGLPRAARELRLFCGLPIAWGAMTLARAERNAQRAKVGRGAIRSSIVRFTRLAGDDDALRAWFRTLLRLPEQRPA